MQSPSWKPGTTRSVTSVPSPQGSQHHSVCELRAFSSGNPSPVGLWTPCNLLQESRTPLGAFSSEKLSSTQSVKSMQSPSGKPGTTRSMTSVQSPQRTWHHSVCDFSVFSSVKPGTTPCVNSVHSPQRSQQHSLCDLSANSFSGKPDTSRSMISVHFHLWKPGTTRCVTSVPSPQRSRVPLAL